VLPTFFVVEKKLPNLKEICIFFSCHLWSKIFFFMFSCNK